MNILPDDIKIENPCEKCTPPFNFCKNGNMPCVDREKYTNQQSILSQVKKVDIDESLLDYIREGWIYQMQEMGKSVIETISDENKITVVAKPKYKVLKSFSQFLQEKMK